MIVKPTWLEAQFMVGWHFVLNSTCPRRLFRAFKITLTKKEANIFPSLHLANSVLDLIRDLGHIIKNDQCDDGDVQQHCRWIQKWPSLKACCTLNLYSSFVVQLQPSKSGKNLQVVHWQDVPVACETSHASEALGVMENCKHIFIYAD